MEKTWQTQKNYLEFIGPNYNVNGYSEAKYRMINDDIALIGDPKLKVPSKLEVWNKDREWQQHPVVFMHQDHLIMFLPGGKYTSKFYRPFSDGRKILQNATDLGLTKGSRANIASMVKREE